MLILNNKINVNKRKKKWDIDSPYPNRSNVYKHEDEVDVAIDSLTFNK